MTDGQSTTSSSAEVEGYVHQQPPTSSVRHQHDDHQRQHQDQSIDVDADVDADGSPIEHDDDDGPPPPPPQFFPHPDSVSSIAHHHGITSGDKSSRWSARDDVLLCDGLVRQQDLGRCRNVAVFSLDAWEAVAEALKGSEFVSGGAPKTVAQCKARWQRVGIGKVFSYSQHQTNKMVAENRVSNREAYSTATRLWMGRGDADGRSA